MHVSVAVQDVSTGRQCCGAGGEVTAIDSAGFGPIIITKAVTITSPDGVEAGIVPTSSGNAITIGVGTSDTVVLRGLTLDGGGVGFDGILFNAGGRLVVTNCVLQNFGNAGIQFFPASDSVGINFLVEDTLLSNVEVGVNYSPSNGSTTTARGTIKNVVATNNQFGFAIQTFNGGGATSVAIVNSVASENTSDGMYVNNGSNASPLVVSIDNSTFSGNGSNGITGSGTSKITLGRSVITANGNNGIFNSTSPNTFYSYKDNRINENATDICVAGCSALNTTLALQ